jgi:uncharacterized RDD family membrane protein YckC
MAKSDLEQQSMDTREKFMEAVDTGQAHLTSELLSKLDHNELEKMLIFLTEDRDSEQISLIQKELSARRRPRVQLATIGERVWSYFYDKLILRALLVLWVVLSFRVVKPAFPGKIQVTPAQSIPEFNIIFLVGILSVIVSWRIWLSVKESKLSGEGAFSRKKLGIKIVQRNGHSPGLGKSILRGLFKTFPIQFITLLTMEGAKHNRAIHDRLADTYVIRLGAPDVSVDEITAYLDQLQE